MVENPNRAPKDVAMAVARFVARGGSFMNYYMYYGGQHYGTGAAAGVRGKRRPFIHSLDE